MSLNKVNLGCIRKDCPHNIKEDATCGQDAVLLNKQGQCPWAEHLDVEKNQKARRVPLGKGN